MRFSWLRRIIVFVFTLVAPCGIAGPAAADFIPADIEHIRADIPAFVREFQAFLADFRRWDAVHLQMPLVALALTPEQQRPQMLLILWDLWMNDHPNPSAAAVNVPTVSGVPGGGSGGGTIASDPGPPDDGGGTSGSPGNTPEPSSLLLVSCGSLGLFAYHLVRSRVVRARARLGAAG